MPERSADVARALVENEFAFRDLSELPALIRARWPGISLDEIQLGVRIAVECVLMDGLPQRASAEG